MSISSYRVTPTTSQKSNFDLENNVIKNVVMCQAGEAKGHGEWLEESFIDDLVDYAQTKMKDGVKAHFGHSYNQLGKIVGRYKNVRKEGTQAVGDLHLYDSADKSPNLPNLKEYITSLAQEDTKAIMSSIVFRRDYYYQYDQNGKKVKVWYYDPKKGWISPNSAMKIYVAFKELKACDLVDEGAATESMFSNTIFEEFSDAQNHPQFKDYLEANYQDMTVLNEFFAAKNKPGLLAQIKEYFAKPETEENPTDYKAQYEALKGKFTSQTAELTELKDKQTNASTEITQLKADKVQLEQTITELEQQTEETRGNTKDETAKAKSYVKNCPITQKAISQNKK